MSEDIYSCAPRQKERKKEQQRMDERKEDSKKDRKTETYTCKTNLAIGVGNYATCIKCLLTSNFATGIGNYPACIKHLLHAAIHLPGVVACIQSQCVSASMSLVLAAHVCIAFVSAHVRRHFFLRATSTHVEPILPQAYANYNACTRMSSRYPHARQCEKCLLLARPQCLLHTCAFWASMRMAAFLCATTYRQTHTHIQTHIHTHAGVVAGVGVGIGP